MLVSITKKQWDQTKAVVLSRWFSFGPLHYTKFDCTQTCVLKLWQDKENFQDMEIFQDMEVLVLKRAEVPLEIQDIENFENMENFRDF